MKYNFRNISFQNKQILKETRFKAYPNCITVISGESGSGKSTLYRALLLENEFLKSVEEKDKEIDKQEFYSLVSSMNQFPLFIDNYKIAFHIECIKEYASYLFEENELIDKLDVRPLLEKYPLQLSGGERTRVGFLLSIIKDREIYILDEPTSGLDEKYIEIIYELIQELKNKGKIVIVFSHDRKFIENGDILYEIENKELVEKRSQERKEYQEKGRKERNIKKIANQLGINRKTKTYQKIISIILTIMIGVSSFSLCFNNALETIQANQLNLYKSTEIRIGKPVDNVGIGNSGCCHPLSEDDIQKIREIKHVKNIEWRFDCEVPASDMNDITQTEDTYEKADEIIITKDKKTFTNKTNMTYLYTYEKNNKFKEDILEDYGIEGVYLSQSFINEIDFGDKKVEKGYFQDGYLKIQLPIPIYNTFGRWKTGYNGNADQVIEDYCYTVEKEEVSIPIAGILKGESFGIVNYGDGGNVYIDRDIIEKYVEKHKKKDNRTLYITENGYYLNKYPKEKEREIKDAYIDTVWKPDVYSVYVDNINNIEKVVEELEKQGYVVENEYYDSLGYVNSTNISQEGMLIVGMIASLLVLVCGMIIKYINRKENKQIYLYLKQEKISEKNIIRIMNKYFIRNMIIKIIGSMSLFSIIIIIINRAFVSYTKISVLSVGVVIVLSMITEWVLPMVILRKESVE